MVFACNNPLRETETTVNSATLNCSICTFFVPHFPFATKPTNSIQQFCDKFTLEISLVRNATIFAALSAASLNAFSAFSTFFPRFG